MALAFSTFVIYATSSNGGIECEAASAKSIFSFDGRAVYQ
jgi:hypothetical protein